MPLFRTRAETAMNDQGTTGSRNRLTNPQGPFGAAKYLISIKSYILN